MLRPLEKADGGDALDVVLGSGAPSLPWLLGAGPTDPRLDLHIDTQDMPRLTLEADLAIGAGGSTSWERSVLALPDPDCSSWPPTSVEASAALAEADATSWPGRERSGL
jgi:UDP-2,4-diacetamido-2,4,6-trideoxy-beta-L-altropyranose hydrolase